MLVRGMAAVMIVPVLRGFLMTVRGVSGILLVDGMLGLGDRALAATDDELEVAGPCGFDVRHVAGRNERAKKACNGKKAAKQCQPPTVLQSMSPMAHKSKDVPNVSTRQPT